MIGFIEESGKAVTGVTPGPGPGFPGKARARWALPDDVPWRGGRGVLASGIMVACPMMN
jgi:hypothetical protein